MANAEYQSPTVYSVLRYEENGFGIPHYRYIPDQVIIMFTGMWGLNRNTLKDL